MDCEEKKTLSELSHKASQIFSNFMTRVTKFEELVAIGSRLLVGFHHELDSLRRPPLYKMSKVVEGIIEANQSERMKAYVDAGCKHVHVAVQNMSKLLAYQQGLRDHLGKVKALLDELECLMEGVVDVVSAVNKIISQFDLLVHEADCFEKGEAETSRLQCQKISDYAVMMRIIYSMFKLDCSMQEKIILSLKENSPPDELESYCLMWDLRPFVNEGIMHQAWRFIP
ncbi:FAD-binding protein isoform X2 [Tasmannia lanceolata]|uniref:FAD-binding protein isoform X2 n=1 Tax=Tasmannia lanceolata TaxID=3420 RepID=UPI004063534C